MKLYLTLSDTESGLRGEKLQRLVEADTIEEMFIRMHLAIASMQAEWFKGEDTWPPRP